MKKEERGKRNWVKIQCIPNRSQVKAESRRRVDQRAPRAPHAEPAAAVGGTHGSPGTTRFRRPAGLGTLSLKGPGLRGAGVGAGWNIRNQSVRERKLLPDLQ